MKTITLTDAEHNRLLEHLKGEVDSWLAYREKYGIPVGRRISLLASVVAKLEAAQ